MNSTGLDGRVVVVTGAAAGQGLAEALLLADAGARVVAVDLAADAPGEFAGRGINYRTLDVTDGSAWAALAREVARVADPHPVHGLINNAGITHRARLGEVERADWDRVLAVNLTGPMLGVQALAPVMGHGSSIVNIGSSAALTAHYPVAYTASKWGLRGLTHTAATELGAAAPTIARAPAGSTEAARVPRRCLSHTRGSPADRRK